MHYPRILTLAAAIATVGLVAGCEPGTPYAAKVGDETISDTDFHDHLEDWAASDALLEAVGSSRDDVPGQSASTYSMAFADYVLTLEIDFEINDQEFARRHLEVDKATKEDIDANLIGETTSKAWDEVSAGFKTYLVDEVAKRAAVQEALGDDYDSWLQTAYQRDDIVVNPQYGSWSGQGQVTPPAGPVTQPAGS